ncbi:MAG TPA: protein kinase [Chlamydiales bacterium]|nr:protein kinase [Chlamydiales bacterium]
MITLYPDPYQPAVPESTPPKPLLTYTPLHSCRATGGQLEISITVAGKAAVVYSLPVEVLVAGKRQAIDAADLEKMASVLEKSGVLAAIARKVFEMSLPGEPQQPLEISILKDGQATFGGKKLIVYDDDKKDPEGLFVKVVNDAVARAALKLVPPGPPPAQIPPGQQPPRTPSPVSSLSPAAKKSVDFEKLPGAHAVDTTIVDDDEEGGAKEVTYDDLKNQVTAILQLKKSLHRKRAAPLLKQCASMDLQVICKDAIKANDMAFLVFLQKHGCIDSDGMTPLHYVCSGAGTPEREAIAKKMIEKSTKEQLHHKEKTFEKTAYILAVENGLLGIVKAYRKKDKAIVLKAAKYGNLPLHSLINLPLPRGITKDKIPAYLAQKKEMALFLISKASAELLNTKNANGLTCLECAVLQKYDDIANALIKPLMIGLKAGNDLTETLWNVVCEHELQPENVKLLVEGALKKTKNALLQKVYKRFSDLEKTADVHKMSPHEMLRTALLLERHFGEPNQPLDCAKIMKDLARAPLHSYTVQCIVGAMTSIIQKNDAFKEPYRTLNAVVVRYNEGKERGERTKVMTPYEALETAFLFVYEVPKITKVTDSVFASAANALPKDWMILRDNERISIVTGHVLGTGTFKKASVVMQYVLQANQPAVLALELAVYLHPHEGVTHAERKEITREIEMFKKLEKMYGIVKCHTVRASDDLEDVGILVEFCDGGDIEYLIEKKKYIETASFKQRLQLFTTVCEGVVSMHSINLVHADLKPGNCLVKEGKAKVNDFGTSFEIGKQPSTGPKAGFHSTPIFTGYDLYKTKGMAAFPADFNPFTIDLSALGDILKLLYDGKPFDFMLRLDEAAILSGLKEGEVAKGATIMTPDEYLAALNKEIVNPLNTLHKKGAARSVKENEQYQCYSVIAACKGISPFPDVAKPTAANILQRAQAAVAAL